MSDLQNFTIGDRGVNRTQHPLEQAEDDLLAAQNAIVRRAGGRHALVKRPGLERFAPGLGSAVLAVITGGTTLPASPPAPVDAASDATEFGSLYALLLDLVHMRTHLYLTAATTSIPDNTPTTISWTAEQYDVGNLHDLSVNPDRVTVPARGDGLWLLIAQATFAASALAQARRVQILQNGTVVSREGAGADDDGDPHWRQAVALVPAVAGDYFTVQVEQDTGSALNLLGGSPQDTCLIALRWVETVNVPLPRCHIYRTSNLTMTADTPTLVPFDAEALDNAAMHDTTVNNTRITIPSGHAGLYQATAQVAVTALYVGLVTVEILKNGSQVLARTRAAGINAGTDPDVVVIAGGAGYEMAAGDYLEVRVTEQPNPGTSARPLYGGGAGTEALGRTTFMVARIG
ncbi:MAG: hypothetical protein QN178_14085 [Armatimonadota bacterium]|nr:hypothetical protein [Armatimonadota bacterium]